VGVGPVGVDRFDLGQLHVVLEQNKWGHLIARTLIGHFALKTGEVPFLFESKNFS
jgi:hypothetical protein